MKSISKSFKASKMRNKLPKDPSQDKVAAARARLKGSVLRYDNPLDPVLAPEEWDTTGAQSVK